MSYFSISQDEVQVLLHSLKKCGLICKVIKLSNGMRINENG